MVVEIITIGDELLYGSRVNTNAAYLARQLDGIGLDIRYISTTGDNMDQLVEAVNLGLRRADVVVTTGGLGPTDDDITKKAICKVFKRNLIFHEDVLEELKKRFAVRGIKMPAINQNQALLPQGARFLANKTGSALGIVIDEQGKFFCAMPGVPAEMEIMVAEELLPVLKAKTGAAVIVRHVLRTAGIMESALAEKIKPALQFAEGISLAYLPSYRGVDLAIKGSGTVKEEVQAGIKILADGIRDLIHEYIFTEDDRDLEQVVGDLLVERQKTLAVAESCTGGLLGTRMTQVPGASRYFVGGIIAYSNEVKITRLGVPRETIDRFGAVSAETAASMAVGAARVVGADIGVAITGVAGPTGGSEEKPVGTVFIGLSAGDRETVRRFSMGTDRHIVRERSATAAIEMIRRELLGLSNR